MPVEAPRRVVDLGCGPGDVTVRLAERWPGADITGVDHSPQMLERARSMAGGEHVAWVEADAARWEPGESLDVIYSNAALHWIDGHAELFPRLMERLAPGGCLAVQMPLSFDQPSHVLLRATLADGGVGGGPLGDEALRVAMARRWVASARDYLAWLAPHASDLDVWQTTDFQRLPGEDAVYGWVSGTALRPVEQGLDAHDLARFVDVYQTRLREAYPRGADGLTLFPFSRLFVVATRR